MKVVIDIPEIPTNDKQRWALANGTPYEERPSGEWLASDDGDEIYGCFEQCSKCYALVLSTHMNFCPNCGADMRKEGGEK